MRQMLVATKETQGKRKNDFSWTEEGEPVGFAFECDGESVDGRCGCKRSMSGLRSLKATTTVKIVERGDTDLTEIIKQHMMKDWGMSEKEAKDFAVKDDNELTRIAGAFPLNTILEKRGRNFRVRVMGNDIAKTA